MTSSLMPLPLVLPFLDLDAVKGRLKALLANCAAAFYAMIALCSSNSATQPPHLHSIDSAPSACLDHCPPPPSSSQSASAGDSSAPQTPGPSMLAVANNPGSSTQAAVQDESSKSNKRPKLSLQTSCLPVTFGKSTTALSFGLSTSATSSPTVRNTFSNAYDGFGGLGPTASPATPTAPATASPSSSRHPAKSSRGTPFVNGKDVAPYQLPLGVRGILRNSPVPASSLQCQSLSAPAANRRRKLFPAKKRVNYRLPIEEEITTVKFVAKHSDLLSDDPSPAPLDADPLSSSSDSDSDSDSNSITSGSLSGSSDEDVSANNAQKDPIDLTQTTQQSPRRRKRKYQRSERQVLAAGVRDGLLGDLCDWETPRTPMQRRRKRPRQWEWTLGPIKDGYVQPSSPAGEASDSDVPPPAPTISDPKPRLPSSSSPREVRSERGESDSDDLHEPAPEPTRSSTSPVS